MGQTYQICTDQFTNLDGTLCLHIGKSSKEVRIACLIIAASYMVCLNLLNYSLAGTVPESFWPKQIDEEYSMQIHFQALSIDT